MTDYRTILLAVFPHSTPRVRDGFAESLPGCIKFADLTTDERLADFIGQWAEESDGFKVTVEYASGAAYEGRKDLGNTHPGDGCRFKGRGCDMETGRANYTRDGAAIGIDLVGHPELAAEFPAAALLCANYWKTRGLNRFSDAGNFREITHRINGGYNGFATREAYRAQVYHALKAQKAG